MELGDHVAWGMQQAVCEGVCEERLQLVDRALQRTSEGLQGLGWEARKLGREHAAGRGSGHSLFNRCRSVDQHLWTNKSKSLPYR